MHGKLTNELKAHEYRYHSRKCTCKLTNGTIKKVPFNSVKFAERFEVVEQMLHVQIIG